MAIGRFQDWEIEEMPQVSKLIYPLKVQEGDDTLLSKGYRRGQC